MVIEEMSYGTGSMRYSTGPSSTGQSSSGYQGAGQSDPTWRKLTEKVKSLVGQQIEDECRYLNYTPFTAQDAATVVSERVMMALRDLAGNNFKLIVTTSVLQKLGAGLHTVSSVSCDFPRALRTTQFRVLAIVSSSQQTIATQHPDPAHALPVLFSRARHDRV